MIALIIVTTLLVITGINQTDMKKLLIWGLGLLAVACGSPKQESNEAEFVDSVTEALANGGNINPDNLQWTSAAS